MAPGDRVRIEAIEEAGLRVLECNFCGETLSAADDEELRDCVIRHVQSKHPDEEFDEDTASAWVSEQAYAATDS